MIPPGSLGFGDVSTFFFHRVKFRRKEKSADFVFSMALSQFSFPYAVCPGALIRDMGFASTGGAALGGARRGRLAIYCDLQKGRKMGLEAGDEKFPQSQAGIHESRAVFLNYYAKEVAGGQGQDRLKCGPSLRSHSSGISHKEATQGLLSALTGK